MPEYYLVADVVLSRGELQFDQISPLRAVYLGEWESPGVASSIARSQPRRDRDAVIAANVRQCVDRELGMLFGLNHAQISRLRAGETLQIEDSIGKFHIKLRPESATNAVDI